MGLLKAGIGALGGVFGGLHHHKAPAPGIDAAGAAHAGLEDGFDILWGNGFIGKLPHALAVHNGVQGVVHVPHSFASAYHKMQSNANGCFRMLPYASAYQRIRTYTNVC